jgi:hypothetical protein
LSRTIQRGIFGFLSQEAELGFSWRDVGCKRH